MDLFDLQDIGDTDIDILSPISTNRLVQLGRDLKLNDRNTIIDFGCGKAELLTLWSQEFGIKGMGVDIRESVCRQANEKIKKLGLADKIAVTQGRTLEFQFPENSFDFAVCVAASFTWGGFREAITGLKKAIKESGKIIIGEPYWISDNIDFRRIRKEPFFTESELLQLSQGQGLDFEYLYRATREDIDRYESAHWHSYIQWIEANPDHPNRQDVINYLHKIQRDYLEFDRSNLGWALYVLNPVKYAIQKAPASTGVLTIS